MTTSDIPALPSESCKRSRSASCSAFPAASCSSRSGKKMKGKNEAKAICLFFLKKISHLELDHGLLHGVHVEDKLDKVLDGLVQLGL